MFELAVKVEATIPLEQRVLEFLKAMYPLKSPPKATVSTLLTIKTTSISLLRLLDQPDRETKAGHVTRMYFGSLNNKAASRLYRAVLSTGPNDPHGVAWIRFSRSVLDVLDPFDAKCGNITQGSQSPRRLQ